MKSGFLLNMKVIQIADFVTTQWSGGATTQLAISPKSARVENRDFDWRLSTALVSSEESEFTVFKDYKRILLPLNESLVLQHHTESGLLENFLHPLESAMFEGSWKTTSKGKVHDFNLIYKPHLNPIVQAISFSERTDLNVDEKFTHCFLYQGEVQWEGETFSAPCFFDELNTKQEQFCISANSIFIFISL